MYPLRSIRLLYRTSSSALTVPRPHMYCIRCFHVFIRGFIESFMVQDVKTEHEDMQMREWKHTDQKTDRTSLLIAPQPRRTPDVLRRLEAVVVGLGLFLLGLVFGKGGGCRPNRGSARLSSLLSRSPSAAIGDGRSADSWLASGALRPRWRRGHGCPGRGGRCGGLATPPGVGGDGSGNSRRRHASSRTPCHGFFLALGLQTRLFVCGFPLLFPLFAKG